MAINFVLCWIRW